VTIAKYARKTHTGMARFLTRTRDMRPMKFQARRVLSARCEEAAAGAREGRAINYGAAEGSRGELHGVEGIFPSLRDF
jgi:hypothetical protein